MNIINAPPVYISSNQEHEYYYNIFEVRHFLYHICYARIPFNKLYVDDDDDMRSVHIYKTKKAIKTNH